MDKLKKFEEMPLAEKIKILESLEMHSSVSQKLETEQQDELENPEAVKKFSKSPAKQKTLDGWLMRSKSKTPEKPGNCSNISNGCETSSNISEIAQNNTESMKFEKNKVVSSFTSALEEPTVSCCTENDEICILNEQSFESKQNCSMNPIVLIERLDFKKLNSYCEVTKEIKQEVIDFIQEDHSSHTDHSKEGTFISATSFSCNLKDNDLVSYTAENKTIPSSSLIVHEHTKTTKSKRTSSKDSSKRKIRCTDIKKSYNLSCHKPTVELDCEGKVSELSTDNDTSTAPSNCESTKRRLKGQNLNVKQDKLTVEKQVPKNKTTPTCKQIEKDETESKNKDLENSLTKQNFMCLRNKTKTLGSVNKSCCKYCDTVSDSAREMNKTETCKKSLSEILPKLSSKRKGKKIESLDSFKIEAGDSNTSSRKVFKKLKEDVLAENPACSVQSPTDLNKNSESNSKSSPNCEIKETETVSHISNEVVGIKPFKKTDKKSCKNKKPTNKLDSPTTEKNVSDSDKICSPKHKETKVTSKLNNVASTSVNIEANKDDVLNEKIKIQLCGSDSTVKSTFKKPSKKSPKSKTKPAGNSDSFGEEQNLAVSDEICPREINYTSKLINVEKVDITEATVQSCNAVRNNCITSPDSQSNYNAYCKVKKQCDSLGLNIDDIFNNENFKLMIEKYRKNPSDAIVFIGTAKSGNKIEPTVVVHHSKKQLMEMLSNNQFKNRINIKS